ncbi:phosphoribosyltransferase [Martelella limonii]|uniref:phosphoribosyltransferase n=1 Tax=Martelella limonii TaxID=1647649 RepID=UPI001580973D|nr:phosphoribosyltransferase [Martelella limonii]
MEGHDYWQSFLPPGRSPGEAYGNAFPASLADGRRLMLPIRALGDTGSGLASLIINQASFTVMRALADDLAQRLAALKPEIVVGMPTLGLTLAAAVGEALGHARYVPLGNSRKFWYQERLSLPVQSITTPGAGKRLYIDPRMLPLIAGKRIVLVDDVISSGQSIVAGLALLDLCGVRPIAVGAAMLQTDRAADALGAAGWSGPVHTCLKTPMLRRGNDGLWRA